MNTKNRKSIKKSIPLQKNKKQMAKHNNLGNKGEQKATEYLQSIGCKILHTNWRYKYKEIDIIALQDNSLLIVEVKTRTAGGMQEATEAVTFHKMKYLIEATEAYIDTFGREEEVRFDIIGISAKGENWEITHIPDAFNALDIS